MPCIYLFNNYLANKNIRIFNMINECIICFCKIITEHKNELLVFYWQIPRQNDLWYETFADLGLLSIVLEKFVGLG